jgi:hypothetical protein
MDAHEVFPHVERFSKRFGTLGTFVGFFASVHF